MDLSLEGFETRRVTVTYKDHGSSHTVVIVPRGVLFDSEAGSWKLHGITVDTKKAVILEMHNVIGWKGVT